MQELHMKMWELASHIIPSTHHKASQKTNSYAHTWGVYQVRGVNYHH